MSLEVYNEIEEYNLEDIININKLEYKINKDIIFKNKKYIIDNIDDVKNILNDITDTIKDVINPNINKFVNTNYNNKKLNELYQILENISKNKGSSKDILEIANKIELIENQKENISDDEINITINYLKDIINIFCAFVSILENRGNYES